MECDVVIVGTGAGGGIAAEILSRSGLKVVMVEEGPLKTSADFKMQEKQAYADLYQEVAGRQTIDKSIQILQGRCVGGSTTVNWTSSFRTPERTLSYWKERFGIKGLSSSELKPWFQWVEQRLNIAPWSIPPNQNNQLLADGLRKLGWEYNVIPRNVSGCANLGYCGMGCPINAKQSMLVSCIPMALSLGSQLIARARAEQILVEKEQVRGVMLSSVDNRGQVKQKNVTFIRARQVILAAGAIGSPAILLRSGLQKANPLVGKRTFLHPVTATIGLMSEKVNGFYGAPQSIYSDEFLWRDGVTGEMGYKLEVPPLHPLLASTLLRHHGEKHFQLMQNFAFYQANLALLRDGFNDLSIGGEVKLDKYDYPQLDYSPNEILWRGIRHATLSMAEVQFAAGAKKVIPLHMDATFYSTLKRARDAIMNLPAKALRWQIMSAHVMGGCAMGSDASESVCNSKGQLRGLDNLSILDGSIFPTSLGVNPQLSIYAIVAKLVAQLAQKLGGNLPQDLKAL
ncbi:FAD-binding protein [Aliikangiella coralliicola]|uniref:FAD-binding protein n=2 Tax=Aliikangiella coralliicola TaxID=2592383 RepID=A0A545UI19_9GAMM|nr:FAD-binding protein [Aliikangiella coralliicola]